MGYNAFKSRKKEEYYQIAMEEFLKNGFHQTTMRDLAKKCGKSPGAFYKHFSSKEEIVHHFYLRELENFKKKAKEIESSRLKSSKRLIDLFSYRFKAFSSYHKILFDLAGTATDPHSPLSPFSRKSRPIRIAYIKIFKKILKRTDFHCHKNLQKYIGALMWYCMMAVLFFWVFDRSKNQSNTIKIIELSLPLVVIGLKATRFPLPRQINKKLHAFVQLLFKRSSISGDSYEH